MKNSMRKNWGIIFCMLYPLILPMEGAAGDFIRGADISWVTEMERKGEQVFRADGTPADQFQLLKEYGVRAIRLRVWVDPSQSGGWCDQKDTLAKALRAKASGMDVMIDFHYSDWWADPGKQKIPAFWRGLSLEEVQKKLAGHTETVLRDLKAHGVYPRWVQVGNETTYGFLWSYRRDAKGNVIHYQKGTWNPVLEESLAYLKTQPENYAKLFATGYDAVKRVFPESIVLVHIDQGHRPEIFKKNLETLSKYGAKWDMIGMSLYPYYCRKNLPDADRVIDDCMKNIRDLSKRWDCDVMIVETGFESRPEKVVESGRLMASVLEKARMDTDGKCRGVFYWEPTCRPKTYRLGAFDDKGRPTAIMAAFRQDALLTSLEWELGKRTTRKGNIVTIDIPAGRPEISFAKSKIDFFPYQNGAFEAEILARGFDVSKPKEKWLGFKFMATYRDPNTGENVYPNTARLSGTFPWRRIICSSIVPPGTGMGTFTLGIQSGTGKVEFDLSTFRIHRQPPLWPVTNLNYRCVYSKRLRRLPPHRGVMLPGGDSKEDDFKTLHEWGATLARYQMPRQWNVTGGNSDLVAFDAYIEGRMKHLEQILVWAKKYGVKIVVDMHGTPGGRDERSDSKIFHDRKYADHFIQTWEKIAKRFRGREEIFGYDLVNEPQQTVSALPEGDYWSLQCRAAAAIREIDPETPVIIESNLYDAPRTFSYLAPMALTNIIYQAHMYVPHRFTHQGVFDPDSPVVAYPDPSRGFTIEKLRNALDPVLEFQKKHGARIYIGEFSAIAWAPGAENYIRDCISLFNGYGWDWSYHAFREWKGWSVEHEAPQRRKYVPSKDNPRKRALLDGFRK